jgi:hypothetical protein
MRRFASSPHALATLSLGTVAEIGVLPMATTVVVRYRTHESAAAANQRLVEDVFDNLGRHRPTGVKYMALKLADGASFVHVAVFDGADDGARQRLSHLPAFARFQQDIGERVDTVPEVSAATVIGSYGFVND